MMRKISVTTGSRSEYGILRPVLQAIQGSKNLKLYLIVAGMHLSKKHGFTINEIRKDGFRIFATVNMIPKGDTNYDMAISLGRGVTQFSEIFRTLKPDINVVLGDRDEMLASALAAYHMNIPNAHIHGGDKSKGGVDEYNRHAITKISNIHFAATKKSKERIIKMGENPKYTFLTGSPSIDEVVKNRISNREVLKKKYGISFIGNEILLVQHPITTETESSKSQIQNTLKAIVRLGKMTIAIGPNSDAGNKKIFDNLEFFSKKYQFIRWYRTLPRSDFLGMLKNCGVLVGNSSSGMIEGSYFNTPVVDIGDRQKGRESGKNVIKVENYSIDAIYSAIKVALKISTGQKYINKFIYGKGNASDKIVKHLEEIKLTKELIEKQIFY